MASWIPSRGSSARALALGLALALCPAAPALAAGKGAAKSGAETAAKAEFKKGQTAYNLGRFDEALSFFSKAYEIKALPPILFNIAQCHRQLANYERAVFFYRRFLEMSPPGSPNTDAVKGLLKETEDQLAEQQSRAQKDADAQRQKELVEAREAAAKAEAEAAARRQAEIEARAAASTEPVGGLTPSNGQSTIPPNAVEKTSPVYQQWWLWTIVGVVVVGAAAGGVAYVATAPKPSPTTLGTLDVR